MEDWMTESSIARQEWIFRSYLPFCVCSLVLLLLLTSAGCSPNKNGPSNSASPANSPGAAINSPGAAIVASASPQPEPARKVFETAEAVPAGYLGYKVLGSWYQSDVQAKTNLLYVEMAIVNTDKKERAVAAMKLVDETGKEYSLSDKGSPPQPSVARVGMVAPGQSKRATAVFEVAKDHEYKLKIQGFSAADEVRVKLSPANNPPAK